MSMIQVHNVETNEVIEREMTVDELAQHEADKTLADTIAAENAAKEAARAALLAKLGITEDEAKLLLS
jgi:phosphopantetheinyl transferase (holo-ACP synthase)